MMSENLLENYEENRNAIENFLLDIEILDQVETKLEKFNVFETLGIINTEIRHSNVLGWLLNPKENHGFGDLYIKKLIQTLFHKNSLPNVGLNLFDISLMDYFDFSIRREWRNIDILAVSEENKVVLVIENKVWSKESEHQLKKYLTIVNDEFPNYHKIFAFLTPYGESPSDEDNWITINYYTILEILQKVIELKESSISTSVKLFLEQYMLVLRRYIVGDNELEKICREIYYKHQKALDLIFEYKPDIYSEISTYIEQVLKEHSVIFDKCSKTFTRFTTQKLDKIIDKKGYEWTETSRILLFEIQVNNKNNNKVVLKLIIGPGDDNIRSELYRIAGLDNTLFKGKTPTLKAKWTQILSKDLIPKNYIDNNDLDTILEKIKKELDKFIINDLKEIEDYIEQNYITS